MALLVFSVSFPILICNTLLFLCYFAQGIRIPKHASGNHKAPPKEDKDIPGGSLPSMLNVILMTGYARETQKMCQGMNGHWLLIPESFDVNDIGRYEESKNFVNYWRVATSSLTMQGTQMGLSHIDYVLETPKNKDITIPHFDHVKRYLGLSDKFKLVKKVHATWTVPGLALDFFLFRDGDKLHLVEVYKSPLCEMPGYSSYYDWRKLTFPNASSYKWSPF
eukprot:gnl/TRDRNA2_/TRDRNA2_175426_c2_seq20.p1 gnl/TRDRNA2_/TRDRNA2_175426_c2~~gnl/TRDRNA2_/TRDRNA2_175426_c2_seq20.p1  ORF type:complete len:221 (-),score=8.61 gnl/TRDRNA2_/TRDRNA2_175426_c2_seq20:327-989(-)